MTRMLKPVYAAFCTFVLLIMTSCYCHFEHPNPSLFCVYWALPADNFTYHPTGYRYYPYSRGPGASPIHTISMSLPSGSLQTHRITITFPPDYVFQGFSSYFGNIVYRADGYAAGFAMIALSSTTGFVDMNGDQSYQSEEESFVSYQFISRAEHQITIDPPYGGDGIPSTIGIGYDLEVDFMLYSGIMQNPEITSDYVIDAEFLSVDPDTGEADDFQGDPPLSFVEQHTVTITDCPAADYDAIRDNTINALDLVYLISIGFPDMNQAVASWHQSCPENP